MPADDGASAREQRIDALIIARESRNRWNYVREGMRRYPDNLEQAYRWAYDRIQEEHKASSTADELFHTPQPYQGTI